METGKTTKPAFPPASSSGRAGRYFKYAIGEIILVVIGILIALSINNWNQQRIDRNNFDQQINLVLEELEVNHEAIETNNLLVADSLINLILSDTFKIEDYLSRNNYRLNRFLYLNFEPKFSSKYFDKLIDDIVIPNNYKISIDSLYAQNNASLFLLKKYYTTLQEKKTNSLNYLITNYPQFSYQFDLSNRVTEETSRGDTTYINQLIADPFYRNRMVDLHQNINIYLNVTSGYYSKIPDLYTQLNHLLSNPRPIPAAIAKHFQAYPKDLLKNLNGTYLSSKTGNTFKVKAVKGDNEKEFKLYMGNNSTRICSYRGNLEFSQLDADLWGYDYRVSENFDTLIRYTGKTIDAKYKKIDN
jgi:hypothetical protein